MAIDLAKVAKEKKIKYFFISFVDLFGVLRAKLVPARAIAGMQKDGAGFAGFATWLDMTPAHSDMFAVPDPESLIQLPWKPEVAWLASDLWMDGKEVEQCPRVVLKRQISAGAGFLFKGDGFYITDYRSSDYKKKASSEGSPGGSETRSSGGSASTGSTSTDA